MRLPNPANADPGSTDIAPCGCTTWTEKDGADLIIRPCSERCPLYRWMMSVVAAEGKPSMHLF